MARILPWLKNDSGSKQPRSRPSSKRPHQHATEHSRSRGDDSGASRPVMEQSNSHRHSLATPPKHRGGSQDGCESDDLWTMVEDGRHTKHLHHAEYVRLLEQASNPETHSAPAGVLESPSKRRKPSRPGTKNAPPTQSPRDLTYTEGEPKGAASPQAHKGGQSGHSDEGTDDDLDRPLRSSATNERRKYTPASASPDFEGPASAVVGRSGPAVDLSMAAILASRREKRSRADARGRGTGEAVRSKHGPAHETTTEIPTFLF